MPEPIPMVIEEYQRLQARLEQLKTKDRPRARAEVSRTREYGDFRENAEYQEAKRHLSILDGQIAQLEMTLSRAKIVEAREGTRVAVGAMVVVTDLTSGRELRLSVQSNGPCSPPAVAVTPESPLGKALIGKQADEEVEVQTPAGQRRYRVREISFPG